MNARISKKTNPISRKHEITNERAGFDTTEEIPRGKIANIMPLSQRAYLEISGSQNKDGIFELSEKRVVIGRSTECDIQLVVQNVSRRHAAILFRHEEYLIEDLGSTNGVFVNGVRVMKCVLRNSDQIEIGGVRLVFKEEKRLHRK
jgi:pSer/pThr/pTyr-binding forkhead associated (FHA) protein